jgi:hypothetical protein
MDEVVPDSGENEACREAVKVADTIPCWYRDRFNFLQMATLRAYPLRKVLTAVGFSEPA